MSPSYPHPPPSQQQPSPPPLLPQQRLKAIIDGARDAWTYAIFWKSSPADSGSFAVLRWGDGYYNGEEGKSGAIAASAAEREHRKKVLRELNSLISGSSTAAADEELEGDVTDTEWFFLVSMTQSFANGGGLPGQAFLNSRPLWVAGADSLAASPCERARQGLGYGIRTVVCVPSESGVVELGSTDVIFQQCPDLLDRARLLFSSSAGLD